MNDDDTTSVSDNENNMETYIEVYNKSDRSSKRRSAIRPYVKVKPIGSCFDCHQKETDFLCHACSMFTCKDCRIKNFCKSCSNESNSCCVIS